VTLGDYEAPIRISVFVKNLFAGFSMASPHICASFARLTFVTLSTGLKLNLKNDTLRRRFDSLKYDLKKIEEGQFQ
jgi:hypothetical protein